MMIASQFINMLTCKVMNIRYNLSNDEAPLKNNNITISSDQRQHATNLTGEAVITLVNRAPNVTLSRLDPATCGVLHDDNVTSRVVRLRAA